MMDGIKNWFCVTAAEPDFKQIVEKSLSLFAVFTGATLSFYVGDFLFANKLPAEFTAFPFWSRACLVAAVIALLLRYIVGSAVHLNLMYVPKVTEVIEEIKVTDADGNEFRYFIFKERKSPAVRSLSRLFFDIVVLVVFGILAVSIIHAENLPAFMVLAASFVLAGFVWGALVYGFRKEDREIAKRWMAIDSIQLAITLVLLGAVWCDWIGKLPVTALLAIVYVFCLFLDLAVVSRPPAPGAAQRLPA